MTDAAPADKAAAEEPSDEESEEEPERQEDKDAELLEAAKVNDIDAVQFCLDKGSNPQFKKDGWSPLLWAACNGNEDIVRVLMARKAGEEYMKHGNDTKSQEVKLDDNEDEEEDPFIKPPDASKEGKYTPLHWASYKGFFKVVWILLKYGIDPLDIDMYGNTSVHQAAASGNIEVLITYL